MRKNGSYNYGICFTEKSLVNDDETEIKTVDLGESVHVLYVKNKHHQSNNHEHETEYESAYESADENVEESCCFKNH